MAPENGFAALFRQLLDDLICTFFIARHDGDFCALACKPVGDPTTKSEIPAGHQGYLILKSHDFSFLYIN